MSFRIHVTDLLWNQSHVGARKVLITFHDYSSAYGKLFGKQISSYSQRNFLHLLDCILLQHFSVLQQFSARSKEIIFWIYQSISLRTSVWRRKCLLLRICSKIFDQPCRFLTIAPLERTWILGTEELKHLLSFQYLYQLSFYCFQPTCTQKPALQKSHSSLPYRKEQKTLRMLSLCLPNSDDSSTSLWLLLTARHC